jgi:hypothetical protein
VRPHQYSPAAASWSETSVDCVGRTGRRTSCCTRKLIVPSSQLREVANSDGSYCRQTRLATTTTTYATTPTRVETLQSSCGTSGGSRLQSRHSGHSALTRTRITQFALGSFVSLRIVTSTNSQYKHATAGHPRQTALFTKRSGEHTSYIPQQHSTNSIL